MWHQSSMSAEKRPWVFESNSVPGGLEFQRSPTRDPARISGRTAPLSVAMVTAFATIMVGWVHLHADMTWHGDSLLAEPQSEGKVCMKVQVCSWRQKLVIKRQTSWQSAAKNKHYVSDTSLIRLKSSDLTDTGKFTTITDKFLFRDTADLTFPLLSTSCSRCWSLIYS